MSSPMNSPAGRATLVRSYRNLSEREIRTRLNGPLGDAGRVTAQAELLRRGADDAAPDTTFVTGFAPAPRGAWPVIVALHAGLIRL
jgi:hypothetical protein